jgi:hypothetical protein
MSLHTLAPMVTVCRLVRCLRVRMKSAQSWRALYVPGFQPVPQSR